MRTFTENKKKNFKFGVFIFIIFNIDFLTWGLKVVWNFAFFWNHKIVLNNISPQIIDNPLV